MNPSPSSNHHVTAVIAHLLKPGREADYAAWMHEIIPVAKTFPGYLGVNILRPKPGIQPEYIIVLHFDNHEYLQAWLNSPERQNLIARTQSLIQEREEIQVLTGLETWFELPKRPQPSPPKRYKMALLTWLSVFLTLLVVGRILQPLLAMLPGILAQMMTIGVVVWLLTYVIMPRLTQVMRPWLYPSSKN